MTGSFLLLSRKQAYSAPPATNIIGNLWIHFYSGNTYIGAKRTSESNSSCQDLSNDILIIKIGPNHQSVLLKPLIYLIFRARTSNLTSDSDSTGLFHAECNLQSMIISSPDQFLLGQTHLCDSQRANFGCGGVRSCSETNEKHSYDMTGL